jgi:hypothetical protein
MSGNLEILVDYRASTLDVEITTRLNIRGEPSRKANLARRVKPPEVLQADLLVLGDDFLGNSAWYREKGTGLFFWSGGARVAAAAAPAPVAAKKVNLREDGTIRPLTVSELEKTFGKFAYTSNANGSIAIDLQWTSVNIVPFMHPLLDAIGVHGLRVHRLAEARFKAAFDNIQMAGSAVSDQLLTCGGTFVPRHIARDIHRPLSSHSWGVAVDLNVEWNAYHHPPQRPGMRGSVYDLLPFFTEQGFAWGGHFSAASSDGMHFELADYGIEDFRAQVEAVDGAQAAAPVAPALV